jgi:hypothetical protein
VARGSAEETHRRSQACDRRAGEPSGAGRFGAAGPLGGVDSPEPGLVPPEPGVAALPPGGHLAVAQAARVDAPRTAVGPPNRPLADEGLAPFGRAVAGPRAPAPRGGPRRPSPGPPRRGRLVLAPGPDCELLADWPGPGLRQSLEAHRRAWSGRPGTGSRPLERRSAVPGGAAQGLRPPPRREQRFWPGGPSQPAHAFPQTTSPQVAQACAPGRSRRPDPCPSANRPAGLPQGWWSGSGSASAPGPSAIRRFPGLPYGLARLPPGRGGPFQSGAAA